MRKLDTAISRRSAAALLLGGAMTGRAAMAQDYPNRPIRVIVPLAAGGPGDLVTRAVSDNLGTALGQRLVIENRPGAGSNIGFAAAAGAAPDGYTLLVGLPPLTINPSLFPNVGYDPVRSFTAISRMAAFPLVLITNVDFAASDLPGFVAAAKARPRAINYGSSGNGSTPHLAGVLLSRLAEVELTHVPYQGIPQMLNDLMAGRIQAAFVAPAAALPLLSAGRAKAITVLAPRRTPSLPDVRSAAEQGMPDFSMATWYALLAPAGTPEAIVQRIHQALGEVLRDPTTQKRFEELGAETAFDASPGVFQSFIASDVTHWREIVRSINAVVD
jgi:tripartite-type tricarboxylate transporter receptor subunit TctC